MSPPEGGLKRHPDLRPMGKPLPIGIVQRNDIISPEQDPIESAGGVNQFGAGSGGGNDFDHRVDGRGLNARIIPGAGCRGGVTAPVKGLFIAGREGLPPAIDNHIEIIGAETVLIARTIGLTQRCLNAEDGEIFLIRRDELDVVTIVDQEFDRKRAACFAVAEDSTMDLPSCRPQQFSGNA